MTAHRADRGEMVYAFIKEYRREHGYPPTVREIMRGVGLASTSGVHRWLHKLQAEGRLDLARTARGIGGPSAETLTAAALHRWRHPTFKGYARCTCEADAALAVSMVAA